MAVPCNLLTIAANAQLAMADEIMLQTTTPENAMRCGAAMLVLMEAADHA